MRTSPIDQVQTTQFEAIARPAPAAAECPFIAHPSAWRYAFTTALVLAWLALMTGAYVLARVWMILWMWRS